MKVSILSEENIKQILELFDYMAKDKQEDEVEELDINTKIINNISDVCNVLESTVYSNNKDKVRSILDKDDLEFILDTLNEIIDLLKEEK